MKLLFCLAAICLVSCYGATLPEEKYRGREMKHEERIEKHERVPLEMVRGEKKEEVRHGRQREQEVSGKRFSYDERGKEELLKKKTGHLFYEKSIEYFLKNPNRLAEKQCFDKFQEGESIDFVIDLAPSPSQDSVDEMCSESPIALFLERIHRTPSRAYFDSVQTFIDKSTFNLKPELCHTVIYENGRKFYIRGRAVEDVEEITKLQSGGEFSDMSRNLRTLWPVATKEADSFLSAIVKNNLGRMTKQALWNRDNGLPTVLNASRRSKPIYTVVVSDGWSGAKIHDLTDDLTRTTVIDIGNRRFVKNIEWNDMKKLANVVTLTAPQQLPMISDTIRNMACRFGRQE